MNKNYLFSKISIGLILILASLIGWQFNGSILFVALLLLGLIKFLGAILHTLTGKTPFNHIRTALFVLFLGAIIGFIFFDLPGIYLFQIWTYDISREVPNPFSNFILYALETLGWGAFLMVFYDSYQLIHLGLDRKFHKFGLSHHHKSVSQKTFSIIGLLGIFLLLYSITLSLVGFRQSWWPPSLAALALWFMLENIEYKQNGKTFLASISQGHLMPLISILIGSLGTGFIFEYFNIISPTQHWIYFGLPFENTAIAGVPIFLLLSWAWMYIIFLSIYSIIYKSDSLWK